MAFPPNFVMTAVRTPGPKAGAPPLKAEVLVPETVATPLPRIRTLARVLVSACAAPRPLI